MKKLILISALLLSWAPYLFLATSVEVLDTGYKAFNCFVKSAGKISQTMGLGAVYYNPIRNHAFLKGREIMLPYFFKKDEILYAQCNDQQFEIGTVDFVKINDRIHIDTEFRSVRFFGHELFQEEGIYMFGTGWDGDKEGETILIRLIDDKEVKFFHGVPVK